MRYADDANIYVRSPRAGERVLASVERFLNHRLKLRLNRDKSRVAGSWKCDYLGYGMSWHSQPRLRVATMSLRRVRDRLRELLRGAGPQDGECHRAGKPGAARLGRLLQAQPEQASTGRAGWLGQAQTSLCHLAAMEAALYEGAQPDAPGIERGACLQVGLQWPRPVVELRSAACESGAAEEAMGQTWTGLDTGYDQSA